MQKSAEVMKGMQELIKVSDIAATMRDMSKEMMKVFNCWYISMK
jgi:charged multivesicular body protein 3